MLNILLIMLIMQKKTWEGIQKIVNVKKMTAKPSQLNVGGNIIDDDKELASNYNHFFVNVGQNTENAIPKVPNISPSKFLKNRNQINFVIAYISNKEILDIINSLENKSTGPFIIPVKLLSLIPDLLIIPLAFIINMSIQSGVFPELLKVVKVIPIHKGGSTQGYSYSQGWIYSRLFLFTRVDLLKTSTIIDQSHCYLFLIKLLKK